MSLRDRMTRLDGELVEAREVLERVAPGEPRVQAPATVAEAFALADAAQAAKAKENVRLRLFRDKTHVDDARRTPRAPARARRRPRARRARPRTIDPFTKKPRSRFFERPLFFVSLSRRFRSGVGGGVGFGFARRFRSDSPFPHYPRPSMRCSRRSTRGARATTRRRRRTRPRGGVTWTLSSAKCAPETCTPCFHRAGGTTTPTCACRRSAGSTTSLSRTAFRNPQSRRRRCSFRRRRRRRRRRRPARAAAAGVRLRRRSGRVHHRRPVHPTWAGHSRRDAPRFTRVTRGGARELDGAPGSATPRAPGARKNDRRASGPRAAERRGGGRRPALAARPRRGRGALQRARRVRGGRRGAADGDRGGGAAARARWTPSRRGCARRRR